MKPLKKKEGNSQVKILQTIVDTVAFWLLTTPLTAQDNTRFDHLLPKKLSFPIHKHDPYLHLFR